MQPLLRNLLQPVLSPLMNAIRSGFSVRQLFSAGEVGVFYDVSDWANTCFQDSAGTTPVTAVEQPVGLILDKSKGLVLGPELVTNGGFDSDITGWTPGNVGKATLAWSAGTIGVTRVFNAADYPNARATITGLVVGRTYALSATTINALGLDVYRAITGISGSEVRSTSTAGTLSGVFVATATTHTVDVGLWDSTGVIGNTVYFDNISVRELPGQHATQATAASRPTLSARVNLLTKTEDFSHADWGNTSAPVTANAITAPDGTMSADLILDNVDNAEHFVAQACSLVANVSYTQSVYAKAGTSSIFILRVVHIGASGATTDIEFTQTGGVFTAPSISGLATSTSAVLVGDGWYKCSVTYTLNGTVSYHALRIYPNTIASAPGTGVGAYFWGASLVPADQASLPYQRVDTATSYDTVGFPTYLKFDGVDDSLATASIDFSAGDKMTVVAGVRKLSDAAVAMLAELSVNSGLNNGTFDLLAPATVGATFGMRSRGTASVDVQSPATYAAPSTRVITTLASISGDSAILRINGSQVATSATDQGTGNYGNHALYIGRRAGTSLPFNGHLYGLVVRASASTDAQIVAAETWMNSKTGAY